MNYDRVVIHGRPHAAILCPLDFSVVHVIAALSSSSPQGKAARVTSMEVVGHLWQLAIGLWLLAAASIVTGKQT